MPADLGVLTLVLLVATVLTRVRLLSKSGVQAFKFGELDKTDFLIPPFALFYFYLAFANAFGWPTPVHAWVHSVSLAWLGVVFCLAGLTLLFLSLVAFGRSFRVGIDTNRPDKLVTSGVFAVTRNPIYVGFGFVLLGELFIDPHWVLLLYLFAGIALFHRQVLREESFLREHYGNEYELYCSRVRRYL